jgi:hypothetical protein
LASRSGDAAATATGSRSSFKGQNRVLANEVIFGLKRTTVTLIVLDEMAFLDGSDLQLPASPELVLPSFLSFLVLDYLCLSVFGTPGPYLRALFLSSPLFSLPPSCSSVRY